LQKSPLEEVSSSEPQKTLVNQFSEPFVVPEYESNRILAHVTTDKTEYRPGEFIFTQTYLVDALSKLPKIENVSFRPVISVHNMETDEEVISSTSIGNLTVRDGSVMYNVQIPDAGVSGDHYIKYESPQVPVSYRKISIFKYSVPKYYVTVDFDKKNYQPGERALAKVKVRNSNGTALRDGTTFTYHLDIPHKVDGKVTVDQ